MVHFLLYWFGIPPWKNGLKPKKKKHIMKWWQFACVHPPIFRQTHILIILIKSPLNHHSITILDHFCPVTVGRGVCKADRWDFQISMISISENVFWNSKYLKLIWKYVRCFLLYTWLYAVPTRLVPTSSSTTHAIPCSWHRFQRMCFSGIYVPTGITKACQDVSNNICICIYTFKNTI